MCGDRKREFMSWLSYIFCWLMPFQLTDELQKVDEKLKATEALLETKVPSVVIVVVPRSFYYYW